MRKFSIAITVENMKITISVKSEVTIKLILFRSRYRRLRSLADPTDDY